ncbi:MAG TPA: cysteine--tRNA ligase [Dehalococcoidia bacterium]|nr:cysteine--tRNA ligase [Dehalococcoidia bacterium]
MKLYNTMSGQKEEFVPARDPVRMYVCGVTPYAEAHMGHAMSYISFDVLRRYLEHRDYRVFHVQNFTDIDDKIIARAHLLGVSPSTLAETYIQQYEQQMATLNILRASAYPRATLEIEKMQEIISGLIAQGYAYGADGDVYFRIAAKADYGKLSGRSTDSLMAGARVDPDPRKENPLDFALWKGAKEGEPAWPSPWGPGRPGWHIECSAMALKYLGEEIDIHGGGQDLVFPHHENETAQSEAYTGHPFARYWLHNGLMQMGEEKMSKSLGNLIPVGEALERYGADALRIFVLSSHYRSPLTYSEEGLEGAQRAAERLRLAAELRGPVEGPDVLDPEAFRSRFLAAVDDDLGTPQALAALFDLAREINRARDEGRPIEAVQRALREMASLLGLTLAPPALPAEIAPFVDLLVQVREDLRTARQYDLADAIRAHLQEMDIALEDTPEGPRWRRHLG